MSEWPVASNVIPGTSACWSGQASTSLLHGEHGSKPRSTRASIRSACSRTGLRLQRLPSARRWSQPMASQGAWPKRKVKHGGTEVPRCSSHPNISAASQAEASWQSFVLQKAALSLFARAYISIEITMKFQRIIEKITVFQDDTVMMCAGTCVNGRIYDSSDGEHSANNGAHSLALRMRGSAIRSRTS
jgi:hypothetical protein